MKSNPNVKPKQKVLLIGWDAADWKAIQPLIDKGLMPHLERLINRGVMAELETLRPALSPMLWTSIATGKRPYKHGIHGFSEIGPDDKVRPVTITNRKGKAFWNILSQENYKTHTVGWWPSHPAEPINGIAVSNFYHRATGHIGEPWPMTEGTVYPASKKELFADLRLHPQELTESHIEPFIPEIKNIEPPYPKKVHMLGYTLAECSTVHSATTYILENEDWDVVAVYQDAIDHFKHGFMRYHPPKRPHISEEEYKLYHNVVTAAYRFHDMMLGRLLDLVGEETTVFLVSDHGFHPDEMRPFFIPKEPSGPAREHSQYGIFVAAGPNIKEDEWAFGASLLDVTPTLLAALGLPIGRDMDGKVLQSIFKKPPELKFIPSWDEVEGDAGLHDAEALAQTAEIMDKEALQQLVELGYIEAPEEGESAEGYKAKTLRENRYNLAISYTGGGKWEEAVEILEELFSEDVSQVRFGLSLAKAYVQLKETQAAREVIDKLKAYLVDFNERLEAATEAKDIDELKKLLRERWAPDHEAVLNVVEGQMLLSEERPIEALKAFQRVIDLGARFANLRLNMGRCEQMLRRWDKAIGQYQQELRLNPKSAIAHQGIGFCYLQKKEYAKALDAFWDAVGLSFQLPFAHYHIGECLYRLRQFEQAVQAYQICLKMQPNINKARLRLARIYREELKDEAQAKKWEAVQQKNTDGEIIVVSGLPRSGTSMMMQLLEKAGLPLFTDRERYADDNNPKGYLEHNAVMSLHRDSTWVPLAKDKVVKVVAPLLKYLPDSFSYKVIFMRRPLDEIMRSQQRMLERMGKREGETEETYSLKLQQQYERVLNRTKRWMKKRRTVQQLDVDYHEALKQPAKLAQRLSEFLGRPISEETARAVIDPSLYRERLQNQD